MPGVRQSCPLSFLSLASTARLRLSARLPVWLVQCLLDIAHSLLDLAFPLLRSAFSLLVLVTSQFSNLALDFACHILGGALHLIAVHGCSLDAAHTHGPRYCHPERTTIGVGLNVM